MLANRYEEDLCLYLSHALFPSVIFIIWTISRPIRVTEGNKVEVKPQLFNTSESIFNTCALTANAVCRQTLWEDSCRVITAWCVSVYQEQNWLSSHSLFALLAWLNSCPIATAMEYKQIIAHRLGCPPEYNYSALASYYILVTVLITGLYFIPIHIPYTYTYMNFTEDDNILHTM